MADPIYELISTHFDALDTPSRPLATDPTTTSYLRRLTTLSVADLQTSEPSALSQQSHALLRSLQSLSKRSHKAIISSATQLSRLSASLPRLLHAANELRDALPPTESAASRFAGKYRRGADEADASLLARKRALLLNENAERISNLLDLPSLLSTAISSASQPGAGPAAAAPGSSHYGSALDLHAHVRRLATLHPDSPLVAAISRSAEAEMKVLAGNLLHGLQSQNVKLAGAMRTIGWLRRVAPELDESLAAERHAARGGVKSFGSTDGALGALFLVCRLANLVGMLEALEPLRELAEQESATRRRRGDSGTAGPERGVATAGQQTERYLKRYVEVFREQSFAVISMYRSIFPSALPVPGGEATEELAAAASPRPGPGAHEGSAGLLLPLPSPLATFPSHLVDMLFSTLREYMPNITERSSRDSLMAQILYCAGSLGRLGGDFSMMLALLEDGGDGGDEASGSAEADEEPEREGSHEWVEVMKKHRVQASRLELLASGVGAGKSVARDVAAVAVASPLSP